jgi:hypothetical protein
VGVVGVSDVAEAGDAAEAPGLDIICRRLSMLAEDEQILAVTAVIFDGLPEYHRRARLLGRNPG